MSGLLRFTVPSSFRLRSGEALHPEAFVAYETFGELNAEKSNAILWNACYAQRSEGQRDSIGEGKRFDPSRYFVITVNMLGNGSSYSPTTEGTGGDFPKEPVTYYDNVALQEALMRSLGIERLALIYGFSMGAMIALQWAVQFPTKVASVVAVCGSARCNPANAYFLRTLQQVLTADPSCERDERGRVTGFREKPAEGIRNFARTYADWIFDAPSSTCGASPDSSRPEYARSKPGGRCFAEGLALTLNGTDSESAFLEAWCAFWAGNWDAMEYYVISQTWLSGDVAADPKFEGDLARALGEVQAKVYLMPGSTDQYFVAEEIEAESRLIPRCVYEPLVSPWGHTAEGRPECQAQIQAAISACLAGE